jgi:hypothetical protein
MQSSSGSGSGSGSVIDIRVAKGKRSKSDDGSYTVWPWRSTRRRTEAEQVKIEYLKRENNLSENHHVQNNTGPTVKVIGMVSYVSGAVKNRIRAARW